eukprot:comp20935_c0_seq1/m.27962 comp20935_c0_seq1/g.27962  ORF comp20935_c0_seq1/g.27962 comp20935_c0_seq1/m.27962 type:complete len:383 (-) comp20935_c0_seq1:128-1276(-)
MRLAALQRHSRLLLRHTPVRLAPQLRVRGVATEAGGQGSSKQGGFWAGLKWTPIPVSMGLAVIAYQGYKHAGEREARQVAGRSPEELVLDPWMVTLIRKLPSRLLSQLWGNVADATLPVWLRQPLFQAYAWAFGCHLEEVEAPSLATFASINDFFTRTLKPGARPIQQATLVSPADARVLYHGPAQGDSVEQVKGVRYSLKALLGLDEVPKPREGHVLQHIILYLAPGDYHRYHSPADWSVTQRRHFPGDLLSVNPGVARIVQGLFNYNERVALLGTWQHGFMSYVAVGATNVGSMVLKFDKDVVTNRSGVYADGECYEREYDPPVGLHAGDEVGMFRMGSTIVLVAEVPDSFTFDVVPGQRVAVGQAIGHCTDRKAPAQGG